MSEPGDDKPRTELFVRSIPPEISSEKLGEYFSDFAPVKHAVVVSDKETGESKRFGFAAFATPEDALTAKAEAAKTPIAPNRFLQIEVAKPRQRKEPGVPQVTDSYEREKRRPRLLIRNCPWSLRKPQELVKIFSKYGKVVDAYIPRGDNNRMSGFAFVTMKRKKHAKKAIEESKGLKIHDREVNVSLALEKSQWLSQGKAEIDLDESESESDSEAEGNAEDNEDESKELHDLDEIPIPGDDDDDDDDDDEDEDEEDDDEEDEEEEDDDDMSDEEGEAKDSETAPTRKSTQSRNFNTIFVRNLPYDADNESLKDHFEQFGPVAYALHVLNKEGQPRGTAFIAFKHASTLEQCLADAPDVKGLSLLVPDDIDRRYVYEGRVLHVARAVAKDTAERLREKGEKERMEAMGKAPRIRDKRRLFLLNEGRIAPGSKLAQLIPKAEMEIREKSYKLRKTQLTKNPSLHLSMTRLAIRNIPRSMTEKALKALGRKAIVEFAKECKAEIRQPLTKEEIIRSIHYQDSLGNPAGAKKHGVVKQAKIIKELKGSGDAGRSRGYGFLELKNHKNALMALRWLNGHLVTKEELEAGGEHVTESEKPRRLVVEFAIENAQVVKRQREKQYRAKENSLKRKAEEMAQSRNDKQEEEERQSEEKATKKGNSFVGRKRRHKKMKK